MLESQMAAVTDNDKLCRHCKFVISVRCEGTYYPHHQSAQELHESAQGGCPLCLTLWFYFSYKAYDLCAEAARGKIFVGFKFVLLAGSHVLEMPDGSSDRNIKFHFRAMFSEFPPPHGSYGTVVWHPSPQQDFACDYEELSVVNIIALPLKGEQLSY